MKPSPRSRIYNWVLKIKLKGSIRRGFIQCSTSGMLDISRFQELILRREDAFLREMYTMLTEAPNRSLPLREALVRRTLAIWGIEMGDESSLILIYLMFWLNDLTPLVSGDPWTAGPSFKLTQHVFSRR